MTSVFIHLVYLVEGRVPRETYRNRTTAQRGKEKKNEKKKKITELLAFVSQGRVGVGRGGAGRGDYIMDAACRAFVRSCRRIIARGVVCGR